ncbi:efflux RND transporter periplasmic adaptor subunit [Sagittula salina]|uniref:HlyD family efflux transporter periplasmic adaptor subunit n=1 Tax=Sagittula salina TaxID=2820268 RepID=A0A940S2U3_9RHOB|nr:HlyD family efflux transporter periplasmic adaptor subunit [Sagittula salina]MBP0484431.1 HlyD family efflux transporter periplasmic adaptor subunit [Sagittula salina]
MPSLRTVLIALVALAIATALATVAFRTEPEPVDLHTVSRGPLQVTVSADAVTRVREIYEVSAPVAGIAQRAPVRVGDRVVAGETVVAVVEPAAAPILDTRSRAQAEAALAEARAAERAAYAELHSAEDQLAYAQSQHDRTVQLVDRGITSLTALESVTLALHAAEAAVDAAGSRHAMAEGSVERAAATLADPAAASDTCCRQVLAPVSGVVLRVDVLSQRTVGAGTPLLAVGDPSDLEIAADLLSADAVRLPPEARATAERWGGPDPLEARLRRVDPVARTDISALGIEEQRVDAVFDLLTPPEERAGLGANYGLTLRTVLWEDDDVLRLPLAATFREAGSWAAFVVEEGRAQTRPITLGHIGTDTAEVLNGLVAGEVVILHPSNAIAHGTLVAPRSAETLD